MENTIEIIIGFVFGLVGSLFGVAISHILSERRDRLKEFKQAAAKFRTCLTPELRHLDYRYSPHRNTGSEIHKVLTMAFDRHETAVIEFRPFLSTIDCIGFLFIVLTDELLQLNRTLFLSRNMSLGRPVSVEPEQAVVACAGF